MELPYDKTSVESIKNYGKLLLGKSLVLLHPGIKLSKGKGRLGQAVEKYHFEYAPNSRDEPDFVEAGLELKCVPLKLEKDNSMSPKERLVLNMINYFAEGSATYETSSFMKKDRNMLLMFHLAVKGQNEAEDLFKIVRTWSVPDEDAKIFEDDWNRIHSKILAGKADEIMEGESFYLGACTKANDSSARRKQPYSSRLAKPRAYCFKVAYLKQIVIDSFFNHPEDCRGLYLSPAWLSKYKKGDDFKIVKSLGDYRSGETFEGLLRRRFSPYYGMAVGDIANLLGVAYTDNDKALAARVCYAIMNVKNVTAARGETGISEFDKAGVIMKTIRLEENGTLKESMSFPAINYKKIVGEKWEDSEWHDIVNSKFFFIVLRKKDGLGSSAAILENSFFWSMPSRDLNVAERFWEDTKEKIRDGVYDRFWKMGDHRLFHVRPHGRDSRDVAETPQGTYEIKRSCWFNAEYVLDIVKNNG